MYCDSKKEVADNYIIIFIPTFDVAAFLTMGLEFICKLFVAFRLHKLNISEFGMAYFANDPFSVFNKWVDSDIRFFFWKIKFLCNCLSIIRLQGGGWKIPKNIEDILWLRRFSFHWTFLQIDKRILHKIY